MAPLRLAKVWGIAIVEYPSSAGASMVVRFRVIADSETVAEDTVVLRASLWSDAWFAREPLASGAALDTSLIDARRIDYFRMRNAIPVGTPDTDFVLSRSVQAGAMLTWSDVGHRPLVKKGDVVEVSAREGLLRVTLKGLALQNGALGDTVTVRNPESLKVIPALVVGENRVEVRL
jgi:flagella basal body P-ring formation protein FlgA